VDEDPDPEELPEDPDPEELPRAAETPASLVDDVLEPSEPPPPQP
jgi:hypothetical protein